MNAPHARRFHGLHCAQPAPLPHLSYAVLVFAFAIQTLLPVNLSGDETFKKNVLPLLRSHCIRCHGPEQQEARIRLDNLSTDLIANRAAAETWQEVRNVLNANEMPPEDELALSPDQRATIVNWLQTKIDDAIAARRQTDGRVALRRLNRFEYQNTMTDLLGLKMDYTQDLPPDPASADGFYNDGQALQMSAIQLEYYLKSARRALDRTIVEGPAPQTYEYSFDKSNVRGWLGNVERSNRLQRKQAFLGTMVDKYPEQGDYLIRVKLKAEIKPEHDFPLLEVSVGYRPDTKILFRTVETVEITTPEEQTLEFRGRVENHPLPVRGQGKFPGLVVRLRNTLDDGSPSPKKKGKEKTYPHEPQLPVIEIISVDFQGPVYEQWPTKRHRDILFESELEDSEDPIYVQEVLERFMTRAYRRPIDPVEVDAMAKFFFAIRPDFPSFEQAMRETLALILIRPDFLYLMEPAGAKKRDITDWELASRLSYFLWSTMPDTELRTLAAKGQLRDPKTLQSQVERMLQDPRSHRLAERFTTQWLHLDVVDRVAIDRKTYPAFQPSLKQQMKNETIEFVRRLVEKDRPVTDLLSPNYMVVNAPMAKHYGIANIRGQQFRETPLKDEKRSGLLGHASVLLAHSNGVDSHVIRRAVFVRDRLLNDPPAPPPPDVPSLEEANPEFHKLSIRQQLELHREADACASCHRDIDPWGIALEHFDAVGKWRDEVQGHGKKAKPTPVQATDTLPDGTVLDGAPTLRRYLVSNRKEQFARAFASRLLTYALGRRLELSDEPDIAKLTDEFKKSDYRVRQLIHQIVQSGPFQTK